MARHARYSSVLLEGKSTCKIRGPDKPSCVQWSHCQQCPRMPSNAGQVSGMLPKISQHRHTSSGGWPSYLCIVPAIACRSFWPSCKCRAVAGPRLCPGECWVCLVMIVGKPGGSIACSDRTSTDPVRERPSNYSDRCPLKRKQRNTRYWRSRMPSIRTGYTTLARFGQE